MAYLFCIGLDTTDFSVLDDNGHGTSSHKEMVRVPLGSVSKPWRKAKEKQPMLLDYDLWSRLPACLVEKVIARLPFKPLFQTSLLSKSWASKFLCNSFQTEVLIAKSSWESFCPLFCHRNKELIGYGSVSKRWHRLPTLSYLPREAAKWRLRSSCGSLLCWTDDTYTNNYDFRGEIAYEYQVYVSNPLTKTFKLLPPRPVMEYPDVLHVVSHGNSGFQVVSLSHYRKHRYVASLCVQIFDSTSQSWSMKIEHSMRVSLHLGEYNTVCCNGSIYIFGGKDLGIMSFNVIEGIWKHRFIPRQVNWDPFYDDQLVVLSFVMCGSEAILVASRMRCILVYTLDPETSSAYEVSRAPSDMLGPEDFAYMVVAAEGDYIYIGDLFPWGSTRRYNCRTREWQWVPSPKDTLGTFCTKTCMHDWEWISVTYNPGLHTFLQV